MLYRHEHLQVTLWPATMSNNEQKPYSIDSYKRRWYDKICNIFYQNNKLYNITRMCLQYTDAPSTLSFSMFSGP